VLVLAGLFDEAIKWAVSSIEKGAAAAGREERPHIAVCAYGAIDDENPKAALAAGQTIASWFPQTAPVVCDLAGLDPSLVTRVRESYEGGEFQEAGEAARLLPEGFVHRVALSGTSSDARRQIRAVLDAGADSVQVFPLGAKRMDTVRSFVECFDGALRDHP
jgi:5,10-methylenetetrahydromethanopterin reductase